MSVFSGDDRLQHASAYDSKRKVVVMFGGRQENFSYNDVREWDGTTWKTFSPGVKPSPRYGHAMAYDKARGEVILMGGRGESTFYNDTWGWNGKRWKKYADTKPDPRMGHAMVYDSKRNLIVMVGGLHADGTISPSTWEWNGSSWTHRGNFYFPGAPEPRYGHAMAYDKVKGVTILHGGMTVSSGLNKSTWKWDGFTWTLRGSTGPSRRMWHSMIYDDDSNKIMLFGGWNGSSALNDLWKWKGNTWSNVAAPPPAASPSKRSGSAMAYDAERQMIVLQGGTWYNPNNSYIDSGYADTWLYGDVLNVDQHGDNRKNASVITIPYRTKAMLNHSFDRDFFKFKALKGTVYTILTRGKQDTILTLLKRTGGALVSDDDSGPNENAKIIYANNKNQWLYIGVKGAGFGVGVYKLIVKAK